MGSSGRPLETVADARNGNWISALCAERGTNYIVSGSDDGFLRTWRITENSSTGDNTGDNSSTHAAKKAKNSSKKPVLLPEHSIKLPGVINQIVESDNLFVLCVVGGGGTVSHLSWEMFQYI